MDADRRLPGDAYQTSWQLPAVAQEIATSFYVPLCLAVLGTTWAQTKMASVSY
jgi:hypothetical protein